MTTDRRDLSNLTAPATRSTGITLPPRQAASVNPPHVPESDADARPRIADPPQREKAQQSEATTGRTSGQAGRKRPYPVYLPGPLADRMKAAAGTTSYSEWILVAYRQVHGRLADVFGEPLVTDDSGLPPRPRSPRRHVEKLTALQLRLTGQEIEVLDRKRGELGKPSKSEFITAVVELYFEQEQ